MKDKLTQKELRFSIAYASGMSAKASATLAGYKASNASQQGHKLLNGAKKSLILGEISRQTEMICTMEGITPQSVISELKSLYDQALTAESHGVCKDILKMLGQHTGLWNDTKQIKHEHSHSFEQLLSASTTKDITPANPAIAMD
jgi:phage terminase small subunit